MPQNLYPLMASVSRHSHLALAVHKTLTEKLTPAELNDFYRWLQLVDDERQTAVNNAHGSLHRFL
jgi:hypothetical protein